MGKKIAAYVGILVFLASVALGYVFFKNSDRAKNVDAFHAVPLDASLLLRVNKLEQAPYALSWLNGGEREQAAALLYRGGFLIDTLSPQEKKRSYLLVSSHPVAATGVSDRLYLAVFTKELEALDFFNATRADQKATVRSNTELEVLTADSTLFYVNLLDRIVAISTSKQLVEASSKQWRGSSSLEDNPLFAAALKAMSRNVAFNLMVNGDELAALSKSLLPNVGGGVFSVADDAKPNQWMCLDADVRGNVYQLAGFWDGGAYRNASHPLFAEKQTAGELEVLAYMPYQPTFLLAARTKNLDSILSCYEAYLLEQSRLDTYHQSMARLGDTLNRNFKDLILSFAPQEVAIAAVRSGDKTAWLTALSVPSGKVVMDALKEGGVVKKIH